MTRMVGDLKAMWRIVEGSMGIDMIIVRFKCVKAFNIIDLYYADPEDITRWKSQESRFQFNIRKKNTFLYMWENWSSGLSVAV